MSRRVKKPEKRNESKDSRKSSRGNSRGDSRRDSRRDSRDGGIEKKVNKVLNTDPEAANIFTIELPREERDNFKEAFDMYDVNGDGSIEAKEIKKILKTFGLAKTDEEIEEMIARLDTSKDGKIQYNEFAPFMEESYAMKISTEDALEAFRFFDNNGDGKITTIEFKTILKHLGVGLDDETIKEVFEKAGLNDEEYLDYEKFVEMWHT